jgi:hypothetical protein
MTSGVEDVAVFTIIYYILQAQSDEDDLGGEDVAVSMEGSKLDEFFQEVR